MNREQAIAIFGALALTLALVSTSIYTILLSQPTTATEVDEIVEHTIYVYGNGEIKVNPDMAKVMLSVVTEASNAKDAAAKNAVIVEELIKRLENMGVSKENIQTTSYNIYPIYYYPKEGTPTITGYRVVNSLEVRIIEKDVSKLGLATGKIVDEAVAAGVNQVTGIIFTVTDETYKNLKSTALKLAVEDAASKAKLIAETLNIKIVGIKSVNEGSYSPTPVYVKEATTQSSTTIIPGQVTIQYTVQVTYLIE
ncbi:MAG: SIMPL domain-containing protein [Nitrososphaeria archaeon]|nr:SIMPL domain-containing protein [Nitrososphaeria archaeon]